MRVLLVVFILELRQRQAGCWVLGGGVEMGRQVTGGSGEAAALTPCWWAEVGRERNSLIFGTLCKQNGCCRKNKSCLTCVCAGQE